MHEFGLAQNALAVALQEADKLGAKRVTRVSMRFGALAGVVPDAFQFSFEALAEGSAAEGCELVMETVQPLCYCPTCDLEFTAELYAYACPRCGNAQTDLRSGRELDLVSIEVDGDV
jgi:hydrogenase nickel incorporation protein HypA/HybF